jgi:hypothetical protein
MVERVIETGGVELCTEPFGGAGDPPILLIAGVGASSMAPSFDQLTTRPGST